VEIHRRQELAIQRARRREGLAPTLNKPGPEPTSRRRKLP
jgi:hypothetical protein